MISVATRSSPYFWAASGFAVDLGVGLDLDLSFDWDKRQVCRNRLPETGYQTQVSQTRISETCFYKPLHRNTFSETGSQKQVLRNKVSEAGSQKQRPQKQGFSETSHTRAAHTWASLHATLWT